jgi:hypothetical protein
MSRRQFVTALTAAAATARTARLAASSPKPDRIDVHHHPLPPFYVAPMREYVARNQPAMNQAVAIDG